MGSKPRGWTVMEGDNGAFQIVDSDGDLIAECYGNIALERDPEDDARLIAKAPDLSKFLETALDAMCRATFDLNGKRCSDLNHAIDTARALLVAINGKAAPQ